MLRRLTALTLVTVLLAPAVASAQLQAPFEQQLQQQQQATQTQTVASPSSTDGDNGGLSRSQEILLFMGGVALICGIGYAIVHDARRRAPVADERSYYSHRSSEDIQRKRKADRKKSKAQKAARKRQRARR